MHHYNLVSLKSALPINFCFEVFKCLFPHFSAGVSSIISLRLIMLWVRAHWSASTKQSPLHAYCTELVRDWQGGLPWLLLAVREVTQESTGFSPNELVFVHTVRYPLAADSWKELQPLKNLTDYVNGFLHRLYTAGDLAEENLASAQKKMKHLYDCCAECHVFSPGDQVLALLPGIADSPFLICRSRYGVKTNYKAVSTPDCRKSP